MHFNIVNFIDCWDYYSIRERAFNDGARPETNNDIYGILFGNHARLMHNFRRYFITDACKSEFTYDHMILNTNECQFMGTDPIVQQITDIHQEGVDRLNHIYNNVPRVLTPNAGHAMQSGDYTPEKVRKFFRLKKVQEINVLLCGFDFAACIYHRSLGILPWIKNGNTNIFVHKDMTIELTQDPKNTICEAFNVGNSHPIFKATGTCPVDKGNGFYQIIINDLERFDHYYQSYVDDTLDSIWK